MGINVFKLFVLGIREREFGVFVRLFIVREWRLFWVGILLI